MKKISVDFSLVLIACLLDFFPNAAASELSDSSTVRKQGVKTLAEVLIKGHRDAFSRIKSRMSVTDVDSAVVNGNSSKGLLNILSERSPGMFVTSRGVMGYGISNGSSGGITIRGVGGSPTTGVLVLVDGQPQYMGIMGHHLPDAYSGMDLQKAEIIRGPSSVLYGSNAMGGSINLVTRTPAEGMHTALKASYGSYGTQEYSATNGYSKNGVYYSVSAGYRSTDGHREFSRFSMASASAKGGWDFSARWKMDVGFNIARYDAQDPGSVYEDVKTYQADVLRGVGTVSVKNTYSRTEGAVSLFFNFGRHDITDGFHSTDDNLGVTLRQDFAFFKGNALTVLADVKSYGGCAKNRNLEKKFVNRHVLEVGGAFLLAQDFLSDRLRTSAGLRYQDNSMYGGCLVPEFSVSFKAWRNISFDARFSKGFRSPTVREMFITAWGPYNEELEPEEVLSYEAGAKCVFFGGRVEGSLAFFLAEGSNMIKPVFFGGSMTYLNTGRFSNKGIEADISGTPLKCLRLDANYSYLDMDTPVIAAPEHKAFLSAEYSSGRFSAGANVQAVGGLYIKTGDVPVTESYFTAGADISVRISGFARAFVSGDNLTGAAYQVNYGYPMPGTVFTAGLKFYL